MKNLKKMFSALLLSGLVICSISRCNPDGNISEPGINFETPTEVAPTLYNSTPDEQISTWYTHHNGLLNPETSSITIYLTTQRTDIANQYAVNYIDVDDNIAAGWASNSNGATCIGHVR
ncbi:hypothetical protein HUW51_05340 [Adhaeribacter swui]|uniref:Uncharacterized protein n=1 Tax=Adhaeribacter swui TaxID=2086471 RepID=A0A7G7G4U4_9BACT|nr:hypothetical protein [Adhaeribacter swui]QNF32178.1 hypothetical protein HUW51_05340 [Adhaeribacter swui]